MIANKLFRFGLGVLGIATLGAFTLPAAPAKADSFAFSYSNGYYPRHYHRHYHGGYRARYVYVAPPPVYYAPPPRVVYVNPPPVYVPPPPPRVVYQAPPQALPGGPLAAAQPQQCREYQSTAIVNGRQVASYGTACLQPDGSWQIVR
jgi:hypothetical protein